MNDSRAARSRAATRPLPDENSERPRRPRLLLVTDRVPANDSGYSIRVNNVIRGLAQAGDLHVCLIDSSTGGESLPLDEGYDATVIRAENPSPARKAVTGLVSLSQIPYRRHDTVRDAVAAQLGGESWDLVWFSRLRTYSVAKGLLDAPTIVDFDDLNDQLGLSLIRDRIGRRGRVIAAPRNILGWLEARRWRRLQADASADVDRVVVCSAADQMIAGLHNSVVVPNGYGVPEPLPRAPDLDDPTIVFVGPLSYEPNRLAAEWLVFEVLPLLRRHEPRARVCLVGYNHGISRRITRTAGVDLVGYVRDLGPYYARAAVAVAPLHSGGGTRLKVIEAMARSIPLVSTPLGCYGFDLRPGQELLVASDPQGFADACASIIRDPDLGRRLASAGLRRYRDCFTADAASKSVAALAAAVLEEAQ